MKKLLLLLTLICVNLNAAEPRDTITATTPAISRESYDNPLIEMDTSMGKLIIELFPKEAPLTVANFLGLAEGTKAFMDPTSGESIMRPFYDGLIFHRVIDGFMIQGGDPLGTGQGGPGYQFRDEINAVSLGLDQILVVGDEGYPHPMLGIRSQADFQQRVLGPLYGKLGIGSQADLDAKIDTVNAALKTMTIKQSYENLGYHYNENLLSRAPVRGVIAMANSGPDSNGSQFFINLVDTDWLSGKHTVFGKVRAGLNVLDAIAKVPVDADNRPLQDVIILSVKRI
ncbi:MAG: peptidylprolyl isomerase [Pseudomonadales bacterium]|nr:peptidylprolyl isomerase [Pseudomonadales bacterium]